jgi:hypothetical protein
MQTCSMRARESNTNLHLLLQLVREDSVEFLDVMLHKRVERFPTERLGELVGTCEEE